MSLAAEFELVKSTIAARTGGGDRPVVLCLHYDSGTGMFQSAKSKLLSPEEGRRHFDRLYVGDPAFSDKDAGRARLGRARAAEVRALSARLGIPIRQAGSRKIRSKKSLIGHLLEKFVEARDGGSGDPAPQSSDAPDGQVGEQDGNISV